MISGSPEAVASACRSTPRGAQVKSTDLAAVRRALWGAADELRANSKLTAVQYRHPVLGLIFLAYAEHRFEAARPELGRGPPPGTR